MFANPYKIYTEYGVLNIEGVKGTSGSTDVLLAPYHGNQCIELISHNGSKWGRDTTLQLGKDVYNIETMTGLYPFQIDLFFNISHSEKVLWICLINEMYLNQQRPILRIWYLCLSSIWMIDGECGIIFKVWDVS